MKTKNFRKSIGIIACLMGLFLIVNCSSDDTSGGGSSPTPDIIVTGGIVPFSNTDVMGHSDSQNIQVKGSDLTADLSLTASDNFQISLDDVNFSSQLSIVQDNANAGDSTLYVRFSPGEDAVGSNSGTISIQSSQATTITLNLSGVGISITPLINVNSASLDFDDTTVSELSQSVSIIANGDNLVSDINLNVTAGFEISLDDVSFADVLQIPAASANDDITIYVRFAPDMIGTISGTLTLQNTDADTVEVSLSGEALPIAYNYVTFDQEHLAFGGGANQASAQTFMLHNDLSNIETIKMYVKLDCPGAGCNAWDVYAHVQVRDVASNEWYEIGRYITPYGVDNSQLDRGFEIDVTDFKSLLTGSTEIRAYIEVWGSDGWNLSVNFDYIEGTPDYPYYAISRVLQYNQNSLQGVPYGVDASSFDLTKSVSIPANAESTHLRTIITGWGHATPVDSDGRPCAEWCFRTHDIKINGANTFQHDMGPIGCGSNPVNPQGGNWSPDRAGWCPGMAVPVRINQFSSSMAASTFSFEYDFEDWVDDGGSTSGTSGAYYAISNYVVVKSNTAIGKPTVMD